MSQEYIEITEKTLDDAITLACQKLSVTSARLEYEVIDEGKAGFFGIGARPAKIRARVKAEEAPVKAEIPAEKEVKAQAKPEKKPADTVKKEEKKQETKKQEVKKPEEKAEKKPEKAEKKPQQAASEPEAEAVVTEKKETAEAEPAKKPAARRNDRRKNGKRTGSRKGDRRDRAADKEAEPTPFLTGAQVPQHQKKKEPVKARLTPEQIEETKKKAEKFLKDIFAAIDMEVEINQEYDEDEALLSVEMEGDDMGVLIGKRGQTLDSLQYLLSLIVNKGVDGYIRVKADTEDYRDRRKRTLEQLAKRKATSVKRNRRPEALEPMNPYERRIIHSALQGDRYVTTYSEGEGEDRRVIITLKD